MEFYIGHWKFGYRNYQLSRLTGYGTPEVIAEGKISFGRYNPNQAQSEGNPQVQSILPSIGQQVFIKSGDEYTFISNQNITCVIKDS